jgi:hypothetical protein
MKTSFLRTALVIGSLASLAGLTTTVHAQVADRLRFTAPFPFIVNGAKLPAGTYNITPINDTDLSVLRISGVDKGNLNKMAIFETVPEGEQSNEPKDSAITFHQYGQEYVLSQIWDAPDNSGAELTMTKQERRLAEQKQAEIVTVPLLLASNTK